MRTAADVTPKLHSSSSDHHAHLSTTPPPTTGIGVSFAITAEEKLASSRGLRGTDCVMGFVMASLGHVVDQALVVIAEVNSGGSTRACVRDIQELVSQNRMIDADKLTKL